MAGNRDPLEQLLAEVGGKPERRPSLSGCGHSDSFAAGFWRSAAGGKEAPAQHPVAGGPAERIAQADIGLLYENRRAWTPPGND